MFFCEKCRIRASWPEGLRGSYGCCEMCGKRANCHDVPSSALPDPKAPPRSRSFRRAAVCEVTGCKKDAIPGRGICDPHAYPGERKKSGRREAIEEQKRKKRG